MDELLLSYFNTRLYPIARVVRAANRLRGRASGEGGTDLSMPPAVANRLLRRAFAGEATRLLAVVEGRTRRPYPTGLSLIALLRRGSGMIEPRPRPEGIPADQHAPA